MNWDVYNTIDEMKAGADERKLVILESVQEIMLVSGHRNGEIPQAQFESAMDKLVSIKNAAGRAGRFMKALLAAGILGASLTACAGTPNMNVDPLSTAEFSIQSEHTMTDEQIIELGRECLLLITEELDREHLDNPNPIETDGWRKAAEIYKKIDSGELHSPEFGQALAALEQARMAKDDVAAEHAKSEMDKLRQRSIGALVSPINKMYHQKLAMAPDFQTWMQTIGG